MVNRAEVDHAKRDAPQRHLIIGGAGFVGSHLIDRILEKQSDAEIVALDNLTYGNNLSVQAKDNARVSMINDDASNPVALFDHIHSFQPNKIWHLAANSDISKSADSPTADIESTFATTSSLCLALCGIPFGVESLVFASTSAIFGFHDGPIDEGSVKKPESAYGWMKLASERLITSLHDLGAVEKVLVARFPNVTGLRQTHGVVRDLVMKYFRTDDPWVVLGDGLQEKPFIHVASLARVLIEIESDLGTKDYTELNISPTTLISVKEIALLIEEKGGLGREPVFGDTAGGWVGDVTKYEFSAALFKKLGYELETSREAIIKSVTEEVRNYVE